MHLQPFANLEGSCLQRYAKAKPGETQPVSLAPVDGVFCKLRSSQSSQSHNINPEVGAIQSVRTDHTMLQVFNGTEANPDFASDIRATLEESGKKGTVLVCNIGGSLTPTQANALGRQSRSALITPAGGSKLSP